MAWKQSFIIDTMVNNYDDDVAAYLNSDTQPKVHMRST